MLLIYAEFGYKAESGSKESGVTIVCQCAVLLSQKIDQEIDPREAMALHCYMFSAVMHYIVK